MTLSAFLRDYLYFPLGGNRKGPVRRHVNLLITMLLGGLWHGAGWNFVLWGGLHGVYLVVNHAWRNFWGKGSVVKGRRPLKWLGILLTFVVVVIAWVPFRATSFDAAIIMLEGMAGVNGISLPLSMESRLGETVGDMVRFLGFTPVTGLNVKEIIIWLALGLSIIWWLPNTQQWMVNFNPAWDIVIDRTRYAGRLTRTHAILTGVILAISLLSLNRVSEFLYFQF